MYKTKYSGYYILLENKDTIDKKSILNIFSRLQEAADQENLLVGDTKINYNKDKNRLEFVTEYVVVTNH